MSNQKPVLIDSHAHIYYRDFADAGHSRGDSRHQQRRRIGSRSARNADANSLERQISLPELDPAAFWRRPLHDNVAIEQAQLKFGDIGDDSP